MERRLESPEKPTDLPHDYLEMVTGVFSSHFDEGLKKLKSLGVQPRFVATGNIFSNEVVLSVSLMNGNQLAATTLHASCDFDPKASSPTVQDLLGACVDAVAGLFGGILDPSDDNDILNVVNESLSALDNVPFQWTALQVEHFKVFLLADKSNPQLDQLTDQWLAKNDPQLKNKIRKGEEKTASRFVTGPRKPDSVETTDDEDAEETLDESDEGDGAEGDTFH